MPCSPSSGAQNAAFHAPGVRGNEPGGHAWPRSSTQTERPASPRAWAATAPPKPEPTTTTSNASPSSGGRSESSGKDVERALDRPREHGALAALDDRPLQQRRALDERRQHRLVVVEVELGGLRLAYPHEVPRPRPRLGHEGPDLVLRQRLDVVVDPVEVDALLLESWVSFRHVLHVRFS